MPTRTRSLAAREEGTYGANLKPLDVTARQLDGIGDFLCEKIKQNGSALVGLKLAHIDP